MSNPRLKRPRFERAQILLQAGDVHKSYQSGVGRLDVLRGVNLDIRRGEILVIMGASGAGKSTLLHILGALDRPTRGTVRLDNTEIFSLSDEKLARVRNRTVGFIFQFHHLLPDFTAAENVAMPLLINGQSPGAARDAALQLLREVGLGRCMDQKPGQLSGGEQQRVAVARALINSPLIILADEPSGNLDRANSEMLHELIWQLSRSKDQAFVIVTHSEELAARADRILRLSEGQLQPETLSSRT
ncbi:ABC transporter ATP-binding protein [bacterium]|nr:ABC transporter ATP-binding protein [bacterium]